MADSEKKGGRRKCNHLNISTTKNLFNEIKNVVHNFWKGYHLVKNKKIADTSFKEKICKVQADIKFAKQCTDIC